VDRSARVRVAARSAAAAGSHPLYRGRSVTPLCDLGEGTLLCGRPVRLLRKYGRVRNI
jgi:hypothetical protein